MFSTFFFSIFLHNVFHLFFYHNIYFFCFASQLSFSTCRSIYRFNLYVINIIVRASCGVCMLECCIEFHALAPGIFDNTFDKSTPVSALMDGGNCATRRVTSLVMLSLPPMSTISSVLASGAATSAAI